jgi:hypothetical protein
MMKNIPIEEPTRCSECLFREPINGLITCRFIPLYTKKSVPFIPGIAKPAECKVKGIVVQWKEGK